MDWAHSLHFTPLEKAPPRPMTEVFDRMPSLPVPEVAASKLHESSFGIRPLSPPVIET